MRFKYLETAQCTFCAADFDDARHTFLKCIAWASERRKLEDKIRVSFTEGSMFPKVLKSKEGWHVVETFVTKILKNKEENESARTRTIGRWRHDGRKRGNFN